MKRITIGKQRKDGKFPVTYWYQGDENMFGGRYPPAVFNKINSVDAIADHTLYEGDILENNSGKPDGYFWRS